MVAKKKPTSKQPVPSPSRKSGSEPLPLQRISSGKATSASKARNAKAVSALKKNPNKPGPLDDIVRGAKSVGGLVKRGVYSNPSNKGGFSNLDKALRRPVEERSIMKMPGDIARGIDFVVRKATPLPDRKKKKNK